jgi:uncharacterized protein (TIGR01777 family)
MHVVIAGGSGFLGTALKTALVSRGDDVRILTRHQASPDELAWAPPKHGPWMDAVAAADVVVNLAGALINGGRWTTARKAVLVDSRLAATRAIVDAVSRDRREAVLLNASAIGFYGNRGDEVLSERSSPGHDFLADLCQRWEADAERAAPFRRVVRLRTGLVLDAHHGALTPLLTPFRLGLGGPMGSGRQYWSWIHRDDWVRLALLAIDDSHVHGPLNLTAPNPVTNATFARTLGAALRRPAFIPTPAIALRLLLGGEMADAMVLGGQRVEPALALSLGFSFRFTRLDDALANLLA